MSYYDSKLDYAMADADMRTFPFQVITDALFEIFQQPPLDRSPPYTLELRILYVPVRYDSELMEELCLSGKVKSHERKELVRVITQKVGNALKEKAEAVFDSFTKLFVFRSRLSVNFSGRYLTKKGEPPVKVFGILLKLRELIEIPSSALKALIKEFQLNDIGLCDIVSYAITIDGTLYKKEELPWEDHDKSDRVLTLKDKPMVLEFFKEQGVKDVLFSYFFPYGVEPTEITWDAMKEGRAVQKRRKIKDGSGGYINLHDVLTPYTTRGKFLQMIDENNICAFYASVRSSRIKKLVTMLIDIDMSTFIKKLLGTRESWTFTLDIANEIIKNALKFGLPRPLVVFSGSRGVHLIWRLPPGLVIDTFSYVNNVNVYLFPGQKALQKNPKSIMHSKFAFMRRITEALLLHTIHNFDLELIPNKIQKLGLRNRLDLFKLSPFDESAVAILLDTSTQNASVHRVFSFHLSSKLISIPISLPGSRKINPKYLDYEVLKEEARAETVISNFQQGKGMEEQYFQTPPEITARQVENLLKPGTGILATLATMLRFSDRWITSRSISSFGFWEKLYGITTFYDYLKGCLMSRSLEELHEPSAMEGLLMELSQITDSGEILLKEETKAVLSSYIKLQSSYNATEHHLEALKNWEFFTRLKKEQLQQLTFGKVEDMWNDEQELNHFFYQFSKLTNILITWLVLALKRASQLEEHQVNAIHALKARIQGSWKHGQGALHSMTPLQGGLMSAVLLHNAFLHFLQEYSSGSSVEEEGNDRME